jgi:tricarballylate dehydrogenase
VVVHRHELIAGADHRSDTYAKSGREVMKQLQRAAAQIFGRKTIGMVVDKCRTRQATKAEAGTIEGLARKLDVDPGSWPASIM